MLGKPGPSAPDSPARPLSVGPGPYTQHARAQETRGPEIVCLNCVTPVSLRGPSDGPHRSRVTHPCPVRL